MKNRATKNKLDKYKNRDSRTAPNNDANLVPNKQAVSHGQNTNSEYYILNIPVTNISIQSCISAQLIYTNISYAVFWPDQIHLLFLKHAYIEIYYILHLHM